MRDPHTVAAIVGALRRVYGDDTARAMLTNGTTLAVLIDAILRSSTGKVIALATAERNLMEP